MHQRRCHNVDTYHGDARALVERICQTSWVLCVGFRWRSLVLLNDSTSEDSATEFAVVRDGVQIESITFGWLNDAEAREDIAMYLDALDRGVHPGAMSSPVTINPHPEGSCNACA